MAEPLPSGLYRGIDDAGTHDSSGVPAYIKIGEAARILGMNPATLRKREDQGLIKSVRNVDGGDRRYLRSEIEELARTGGVASEPPAVVDGLVAIGEAARILGVTETLLRKREREGVISSLRTDGGRRRYRLEDVLRWRDENLIVKQHSGRATKWQPVPVAERRKLSFEDETECWKIAKGAAGQAVARYRWLDFDEAFSDALEGVAVGLSRPRGDGFAWQVSCFSYARWEILRGIRRRLGWVPRENDMPEREVPLSLDTLLDEYGDVFEPSGAIPKVGVPSVTKLDLERVLEGLPRNERVALVNHSVHRFTDLEIAYDMSTTTGTIRRLRERASALVRDTYLERLSESGDSCHCGQEVDRCGYRNRGMCTECDNTRCDTSDGMASGCPVRRAALTGGEQDGGRVS